MPNGTRPVVLAFAIALALALAYVIRNALVIIYVSIVFAVVLSPAVDRVQRYRIRGRQPGRGAAILLIIGGVIVAVVVFVWLALPPIVSDVQQLTKQLPARVDQLNQWLQQFPMARGVNLKGFENYAGSILGGITGLVGNFVNMMAGVFTVIVLTAYFILDGERAFEWPLSLVPKDRRSRLTRTLHRAAGRMRRWLVGQAMLMAILGSASLLVFGLMRLKYFFVLAVFAGAANIVPFLGPILTVVLAGMVAAIDSPVKLLGVLIFYLAYQQVENAYLTPRIMQSQVEISATAILVAILIGGELAGVPGALVAVPSAVLVIALVDEYVVAEEPDRPKAA